MPDEALLRPDDAPLTDLERRLATWTPAPAIDPSRRDHLLFEAGAQAGRRQARRQAGALGLVLLVGLGGWNLREHQARSRLEIALATERARAAEVARILPQPVPIPVPPPSSPSRAEPLAPSSYLALSREFTREGFARLDPAPSAPAEARSSDRGAVPILTPRSRPGAIDPLTL